MIALDAFEQLKPQAFKLVAANTRGRRIAYGVEITVEKSIAERPHRQMGGVDMLENDGAVPHRRDGGMQRMGIAAQRP
jgi:hypothetical protein